MISRFRHDPARTMGIAYLITLAVTEWLVINEIRTWVTIPPLAWMVGCGAFAPVVAAGPMPVVWAVLAVARRLVTWEHPEMLPGSGQPGATQKGRPGQHAGPRPLSAVHQPLTPER